MARGVFRFYEELNDFLPSDRKKVDFEIGYEENTCLVDLIEGMGVPCTEVDLILVNGESVDFGYMLRDGDRVSVYPVFETFNIKGISPLREVPLRRMRFVADASLVDLAIHMKSLGFDVYSDSLSIREIIETSISEDRIILTTSRELLRLEEVTRAIFVPPGSREYQIKVIMGYLNMNVVEEKG